jgi:hypothetical protein
MGAERAAQAQFNCPTNTGLSKERIPEEYAAAHAQEPKVMPGETYSHRIRAVVPKGVVLERTL